MGYSPPCPFGSYDMTLLEQAREYKRLKEYIEKHKPKELVIHEDSEDYAMQCYAGVPPSGLPIDPDTTWNLEKIDDLEAALKLHMKNGDLQWYLSDEPPYETLYITAWHTLSDQSADFDAGKNCWRRFPLDWNKGCEDDPTYADADGQPKNGRLKVCFIDQEEFDNIPYDHDPDCEGWDES